MHHQVEQVILDDGTVLDADIVVMGVSFALYRLRVLLYYQVGVRPATNYLKGVERDRDGGLRVDSNLRLQHFKDIYVAGDIARYVRRSSL